MKVYQVLTNMDCNLRCRYCYEQDKARGANDIADVKRYIGACIEESLADADPAEVKPNFEFVGGETFLHMDMVNAAVEHIFSECHRHNIQHAPQLAFSTNGTLFDPESVRDFVRRYGRHIQVGISIDGTREIHDANRVDTRGEGSYARAVAGYEWLKQHVCRHNISVKATYNHATFTRYAEGVLNLIRLGFTNIAANTVFEEVWTPEDYQILLPQMYRIADYLVDNDLVDTVRVLQINPTGRDVSRLPIGAPRTENHCGSCARMRCLGFDGVVYGCHRFATMPGGVPVGRLTDAGVAVTNPAFIRDITDQHVLWPEECRACPFGHLCGSCAAVPYESPEPDPAAFHARKGQCGFTKARAAAMCHLAARLQQGEGK